VPLDYLAQDHESGLGRGPDHGRRVCKGPVSHAAQE